MSEALPEVKETIGVLHMQVRMKMIVEIMLEAARTTSMIIAKRN